MREHERVTCIMHGILNNDLSSVMFKLQKFQNESFLGKESTKEAISKQQKKEIVKTEAVYK